MQLLAQGLDADAAGCDNDRRNPVGGTDLVARLLRLIFGLAIALQPCLAGAAEQPPDAALPAWARAKQPVARHALLIGIAQYDHATQLTTPPFDVAQMKATLTALHIEVDVVLVGKANRTDIIQAVRDFAGKLRTGDFALVYFSGHGVQVGGINYLVPTDGVATPDSPGMAWVSVDYVMSTLEKAAPAAMLVVLDACRANPFAGTGMEYRDVLGSVPAAAAPDAVATAPISGGLAPASGPASPYILGFAAQPLKVAFSRFAGDPPDARSIYTRTLAANLVQRSPLARALAGTERDVTRVTEGRQTPMESSSALWDLPLDGTLPDSPIVEEDWRLTIGVTPTAQEIVALQDFISDHPLSGYVAAARARLAAIAPGQSAFASWYNAAPSTLVIGSLQGVRGNVLGDTAIANRTLTLRERADGGNKLAAIAIGAPLKLVGFASGAAKVVTTTGETGWINKVFTLDTAKPVADVALAFGGSDEFADVVDWAPLRAAAGTYASKTALTIRTGPAGEADLAHSRLIARLRALRIRDYAVRLGVPPDRIVIVPGDPGVAIDQSRISVVKVAE